jgi:hypothetical protein
MIWLLYYAYKKGSKNKYLCNVCRNKGEKNPMFNKTIYETWYIKYGKEIADKKLEQWHNNKKGQIAWNKGIPISKEAKDKLKQSLKDRVWIYNDDLKKLKRIKNTELQNFLQNGWKQGTKKY